jgi:hypothetical protein
MCWGEHNWPDCIPNFNGVLTLEMTLERFEGRNTVTQLVKGVVTTCVCRCFILFLFIKLTQRDDSVRADTFVSTADSSLQMRVITN